VSAVAQARIETSQGKDPTGGATHFNFRKNAFAGAFQGYGLKRSSAPLSNAYPTAALPADDVYANTHE